MNLMVLTCAVFQSEAEARRKMWIFLKSCEKCGVDPVLYGCGNTFPGYRAMKLDMQLDFLKTVPSTYTHVLYTDGWDAFFTGPLTEIVEKYERMGSPSVLASASSGLGNVPDPGKNYAGVFDETVKYRYPCVGGYLAELPAIISAFEKMDRNTGDDCFSWYNGVKEGWFTPVMDTGCQIFQLGADRCAVKDGRLYNMDTRSFPCVYHLSGGYTDPETGKDDRLIPWAKELGVI